MLRMSPNFVTTHDIVTLAKFKKVNVKSCISQQCLIVDIIALQQCVEC